MTAVQIDLTSAEREFLASLVESTLKTTRIEEHRTRAPSYREHIVHREELLESLRQKLGCPTE